MKFKLYPGIWVGGVILVTLLIFRQLLLTAPTPETSVVIPPPTPEPPAPSPSPTPPPVRPQSPAPTAGQGSLRVSNRTEHPVRIALLATPAGDAEPVHWDFAPQEGSQNGLLLSLPTADLELKPGDILVAFAQDGSRRYWGPYVVGKTALPEFDAGLSEWHLILSPSESSRSL